MKRVIPLSELAVGMTWLQQNMAKQVGLAAHVVGSLLLLTAERFVCYCSPFEVTLLN
jgi:hypothetical protein